MLIANPIYDVVFKYLMEDSKVAKLLISSIIGMEIIDLTFRPQERIAEIDQTPKKKRKKMMIGLDGTLTVYRLDFSAKLSTPEGERLAIIEIQKAKFVNDIMRFRRYLGEQYLDKENSYLVENKQGRQIRKGIPIISIYFLGEGFEHIQGVPVVMVNNQVIDLYSGQEIKEKEDFVESLTHKSFIISIPNLNQRRRNELEMMLSIFDQSNRANDDHILNVHEEDFPERYRNIIRRLQRAVSEQGVRQSMDIEDDIVEQLNFAERALQEKEKELKTKNKELKEEQKQKRQINKKLKGKEKELQGKEKELAKERKANEDLQKELEALKKSLK